MIIKVRVMRMVKFRVIRPTRVIIMQVTGSSGFKVSSTVSVIKFVRISRAVRVIKFC